MEKKKMENNYLSRKWLFGYAYVASIIFGNLLVVYLGIIHFMGLMFPAGALAIGITFSLRDFVQREFGHKVWYFMITSTIITALLSFILAELPIPPWKVALASAVAFIVSEFIDWLVYTITKKDITFRIVVSNLFSTPIDSILFVGIAFGMFNFFEPPVYGQAIVKYLSGLLVLPIIIYMRLKINKNWMR
jgi:hypothetical protein